MIDGAASRRPAAMEAGERTRHGSGERASAAVEFALVLPLVLVMALALVQVGLLVKDQLILAGTARAGAREASVNTDDGRVRQVAADEASSAGLDPSKLEVTITREGGTGTPAVVTVRYSDAVIVPLVEWLFPASVDMDATATMRQESG